MEVISHPKSIYINPIFPALRSRLCRRLWRFLHCMAFCGLLSFQSPSFSCVSATVRRYLRLSTRTKPSLGTDYCTVYLVLVRSNSPVAVWGNVGQCGASQTLWCPQCLSHAMPEVQFASFSMFSSALTCLYSKRTGTKIKLMTLFCAILTQRTWGLIYIYQSISVSLYRSIYLSIYLSFPEDIGTYLHLSIYLGIPLSIYLSFFLAQTT